MVDCVTESLMKFKHSITFFRVLTGSFDKTARIWSLDDGGECLCTMRGHSAEIVDVDVCRYGRMVATSSMDRTTRLFSSVTGIGLYTFVDSGVFTIYIGGQGQHNFCHPRTF